MIAHRVHPLSALLLLTALAGCGRSDDAAMAARGETNLRAPVRTASGMTIAAPAKTIWSVLIDIADWPAWQPDIQATAIAGPPGTGSPFEWTTASGTIHSRIMLFEPERRLAWTGHFLVFQAIHVWTLTALPNGDTEVTTTESLGGWPISLFYSSAELRRSDQQWLDTLRREAERRAIPPNPNHG